MKYLSKSIFHGVKLFRQLTEDQVSSGGEATIAKLHLTAAGSAATRALHASDDFWGSGNEDWGVGGLIGEESPSDDFFSTLTSIFGGGLLGEESPSDDFFSALTGVDMEEIMEKVMECGIDVQDMTAKFLGGMLASGVDLSSPEASGYDAYMPLLLALKDDDEEECTVTDTLKVAVASQEYAECIGATQFFDLEAFKTDSELVQGIVDGCGDVFDLFTPGDLLDFDEDLSFGEDGKFGESGKTCVKSLLGDNPVGNYVRYLYNNFDTIYSCLSTLGEGLPRCVLTAPSQDETTQLSFPLSLEKKMACVVGSSYDKVVDELCIGLYDGLDACLPQIGYDFDSDDVTISCGEEGGSFGKQDGILFFGMDVSVVTGNKIPSFCLKVFEEKEMDTEKLQSRLEYYNERREYGWTIDSVEPPNNEDEGPESQVSSISTVEKAEEEYESNPDDIEPPNDNGEGVNDSSSEDEVSKAQISAILSAKKVEAEYESNPEDIPMGESPEWDNGEEEGGPQKARTLPLFVAVVVIVALVSALILYKRPKPPSGISREKYGQVLTKSIV